MIKMLLTTAAIAIAAPAMANAVVGQPAPAFTVKDSNGTARSLADYKGKTVVLEWNNPECPFVKKFYDAGAMQKLQADAKKQGVVWLTVNSAADGKQGQMDGATANARTRSLGAQPTAYLLDTTGTVGKAYGARTTPHMYVINPAGKLVYAGGIDDTPTADPADLGKARNYVQLALADVAAGRAVETSTSKPYGCSVKY